MLLWMADTACACVLTWIEATLHNHSFLQVSKVKPFLSSFTSITIVQNIITTCEQAVKPEVYGCLIDRIQL